MNNIDVSNDIGGGIFVYTPPYMIVDASMTDGSVLASGLQASPLDKNSRKATTRYPQLNFPDGRAIADMSSLIIFDTSYDTCGIHLTLNAFPSDVSSDWIHDVRYSHISVPTWDPYTSKSVKNIRIGKDSQSKCNRLLFDICKGDLNIPADQFPPFGCAPNSSFPRRASR